MSKIAGELNAEMMVAINSSTYQAWLNNPLTKALKRSFEQSITDPENQPSQYGTVPLAMYEHLEEQLSTSQQRVAEIEAVLRECREALEYVPKHFGMKRLGNSTLKDSETRAKCHKAIAKIDEVLK